MPRDLVTPPLPRALRAIAAPWVISRAGVLLVGLVTAALARGGDVPGTDAVDAIRHLFERWDTMWYLRIAAHGYHWNSHAPDLQQDVVFFPLYPALIRAGGQLLGGHFTLAGALVSIIAFLGACTQLWRLVVIELRDRLGETEAERVATGAVVLLCAYPFALYFSAVYTEPLFLWLAVSVFLAWRRGRYVEAAAWGLLAGLTRPNGVFLMVPLAWLAFVEPQARRESTARRGPAALAVLGPAAGTLIYSIYLYVTVGDPLAWYAGQAAWHWIAPEASGHLVAAAQSLRVDDVLIQFGNACAALLAVAGILPVGRLLGPGYALFVAANIAPPIATHGLLSIGRFTSVLFPLFVWVSWRTPERWRLQRIVLVCAVAQMGAAALFFAGRPMV